LEPHGARQDQGYGLYGMGPKYGYETGPV
jgi:hypothetical protein